MVLAAGHWEQASDGLGQVEMEATILVKLGMKRLGPLPRSPPRVSRPITSGWFEFVSV